VSQLRHVAIIGAAVAGLSTAESLRRSGYDGEITLVGDELHEPYDRPPLSKQILSGKWEPERVALRQQGDLANLELNLRLGIRATSLDLNRRAVQLDTGEHLPFDALVIATGLRARWLPAFVGLSGAHVMRTINDSLALKAEIRPGRKITVIGAGFLGTEIAATAQLLGAEVSLVDIVPEPLTLQLGPEIGRMAADLHREHGVDLRTGVGVEDVLSADGQITGLMLTDGSKIDAEIVVVAIGSVPATDWLEGSGLDLTGGVVCDEYCRAAEGVYAAGDVARWRHETIGDYVRLEQRTNAAEQGQAVGRNLMAAPGEQSPYRPINFGWTDQYDVKIQIYGHRSPLSKFAIVEGSREAGHFIGAYRHGKHVTAVVGWNSARALRKYREWVFTDTDTTEPIN
jgi:3-phenylpropionate/trans-cinnamate dioxygenase ferredoxin reductase subunit